MKDKIHNSDQEGVNYTIKAHEQDVWIVQGLNSISLYTVEITEENGRITVTIYLLHHQYIEQQGWHSCL